MEISSIQSSPNSAEPLAFGMTVNASKCVLAALETATLTSQVHNQSAHDVQWCTEPHDVQWCIEQGPGRLSGTLGQSLSFQAGNHGGLTVIRARSLRYPGLERRLLIAVHPMTQMLACGPNHSLVLTREGIAYTWGNNTQGQLGVATPAWCPEPVTVAAARSFIAVGAGIGHSAALTHEGELLMWGGNEFGQLGSGARQRFVKPSVSATGIYDFRAGVAHMVALRDDGAVMTWGLNYFGQLGHGGTVSAKSPQRVPLLQGIASVDAGLGHTLALRQDGRVYAWGANYNGQLGDGTTIDSPFPKLVDTGLHKIASISAGAHHSALLTTDGQVLVLARDESVIADSGWGISQAGCWLMPNLTGIISVCCGTDFTLALRNDGKVFAWGRNHLGQLGDTGLGGDSSVPVEVTALQDVVRVACGEAQAMALQADGRLLTWGANWYGQLGHGNRTAFSAPKPVNFAQNVQMAAP